MKRENMSQPLKHIPISIIPFEFRLTNQVQIMGQEVPSRALSTIETNVGCRSLIRSDLWHWRRSVLLLHVVLMYLFLVTRSFLCRSFCTCMLILAVKTQYHWLTSFPFLCRDKIYIIIYLSALGNEIFVED